MRQYALNKIKFHHGKPWLALALVLALLGLSLGKVTPLAFATLTSDLIIGDVKGRLYDTPGDFVVILLHGGIAVFVDSDYISASSLFMVDPSPLTSKRIDVFQPYNYSFRWKSDWPMKIIDYFRQQGRRVGLVGYSAGGTVVANMLQYERITDVELIAVIAGLVDLNRQDSIFAVAYWLKPNTIKNLLLIYGTQDTIKGNLLAQKTGGTYIEIPGGHTEILANALEIYAQQLASHAVPEFMMSLEVLVISFLFSFLALHRIQARAGIEDSTGPNLSLLAGTLMPEHTSLGVCNNRPGSQAPIEGF